MGKRTHPIPAIGMRIIKSSVAVLLCCAVYWLRGKTGVLFYSQLAALWCIQPYEKTSLKNGVQRTIGTLIGTLYGLLTMLLLYYVIPESNDVVHMILISIMVIPVLHTSVILHKKDASFFSCVVFLSIVVLHIADANPISFVWERFSDTMIGIIIGIGVNLFRLPRRRHREILFVSGVDETLIFQKEALSDYSRILLNQMLKNGVRFTISTRRTPASLINIISGIPLTLPIIAMDGAVLYDTNQHQYVQTYIISDSLSRELTQKIRERGFHCFVNTVIDGTLMIYHQELKNMAEKSIYKKMFSSPYRNYLYAEPSESVACVYLMTIDETDRIDALYRELKQMGYTEKLKIQHYVSDDYPGFSYLKIYNRNAKRENMIRRLMQQYDCSRVITFGSIAGKYDHTISADHPNQVIHLIRSRFEPIGIPWTPWHRNKGRKTSARTSQPHLRLQSFLKTIW